MLNEFRFQFAREDRPRPYDGPDITGQTRPFPDTAFDFGSGYRFGDAVLHPGRLLRHAHPVRRQPLVASRAGTRSRPASSSTASTRSQTFIGFANGRYIFGSTDGFLNYARFGPQYVECSNGSTSTTGACPAGTSITGPLLLFLQQAGVGGLSVEEAGTQDIPQIEPAFFIQDKWQPTPQPDGQLRPALGGADPARPDHAARPGVLRAVPRQARRFPSDGTIPSDTSMWQPRLGISWDPGGDGKQVVRASAGIFYSRIPGLNLASTRSTDGTPRARRCSAPARSTASASRRRPGRT